MFCRRPRLPRHCPAGAEHEGHPRVPVRRAQRQPQPRRRRFLQPRSRLVLSERSDAASARGYVCRQCSSLGCFATPIALCFAEKGYDLNFTWGVNLHGQKFGGVAMPEMMRWLWRDCTEVVTDPRDMASRGYLRPEASGPSQRELTGYAAYEELLTVRHPSPSTLAPPWTAVQPVAFCLRAGPRDAGPHADSARHSCRRLAARRSEERRQQAAADFHLRRRAFDRAGRGVCRG